VFMAEVKYVPYWQSTIENTEDGFMMVAAHRSR
jgi:hypothetical protein